MKKSIILFAAVLLTAAAFTQSPQKMSYQTVIRNGSGDLVTDSPVGIRISILQDSATGVAVFTEEHTVLTNVNGLASLEVGVGNPPSVAFGQIDWGDGPYFIKSEFDPFGGTNYSLSGTTQLLSVPYALYAEKVRNAGFTTLSNVTSNSQGNYATDDFVFGSPELDGDGIFSHGSRMFFDKSKYAFRAGFASEAWDEENIGLGSVGMGAGAVASGDNSMAFGWGSSASGDFSTAIGVAATAPSRAESVFGSNNTTYSPLGGTDSWNALDRLFVIGNGVVGLSQSDAMVVLKNGNVGLGTATPDEVLEVGGDGRAFFGDGQGDNRKGILIDGIQGSTAARIEAYDYGAGAGLDLVLNTATSGGNVGIRTNSPTATLSVNGTANKTGGGAWAVFSDERLKKEISPYEDGLSSVLSIEPVKFKYNGISDADTTNEYVGVIAQELEKVSPYMINTIEINGTDYLEVDNSAMTYMLINAVKELNAVIASQQKEIEDLNAENVEQGDALKANTAILLELQSVLQTQAKK